jgi:hypothetical protein|tara:strand:+ start:5042 stop:5761 length:720 start_codon:yes stop_codon:yes gene_type:complete
MNFLKDFLLSLVDNMYYYKLKIHKEGKKNCIIFGNGPSLNEIDFSKFSNEIIYATNRTVMHKDFNMLKNITYFFSDNYFFQNEEGRKILKAVERSKNVDTIIVPSSWYYYRFFTKKFSKKYIYVNFNRNEKLKDFEFENNPKHGFRYGSTIILDFCLPLAIFQGFKRIFLVGCDFDYSKKNQYFYGKNFDDSNFNKVDRDSWKNEVQLGFARIEEYCSKNQIEVLNCKDENSLNILNKI